MDQAARKIIDRCRELATISDIEGETTRLFLSPATREAHALLTRWMEEAGLETRIDDIGNVRGRRAATKPDAPTLLLQAVLDSRFQCRERGWREVAAPRKGFHCSVATARWDQTHGGCSRLKREVH